jgi:hypothetical protein
LRRKAATPSKAKPSSEIVAPPSGTATAVGPAWTLRSALTGWTRQNALAAKTSKSLSEDFIRRKSSIKHAGFNKMLHSPEHLKDVEICQQYGGH